MSEKKLKIGLVGCGRVSRIAHYNSIKNSPHLDFRAICDMDRERADTWAAKVEVKAYYSFEETAGWTVGYSGDDATAGIWEVAIPEATFFDGNQAQPGSDQSEDGEKCFLTGAGTSPGSVGFDDVDDGKTTLLSPIFDLSTYNEALVSYWRWYTNDVGDNPGTDHWQVDVTSDGGQFWIPLEYTNESQDAWVQKNYLLSSIGLELSSQVQFRFVAEDISNPGDNASGGSIIEAAVDDFMLAIFETSSNIMGDVNMDGILNILDVVTLVNCVLYDNCDELDNPSLADMNGDLTVNVLDVVLLVNLILS